MSEPRRIALTGGMGAGKSVVAKVLTALGWAVYDSDTQAKRLMNEGPELVAAIKAHFGPQAYNASGLNRAYVSGRAFHNPDDLEVLNQLVHPAVHQDFEEWAAAQTAPVIVNEAALLIQTGRYKAFDATVVVTAPEALRIQRVLARDPQRTEADVWGILDIQWPEEKLVALADYVLNNDERSLLLPQVLALRTAIEPTVRTLT